MHVLTVFNTGKSKSIFKLEYFAEKLYATFSSKNIGEVKKIVRISDFVTVSRDSWNTPFCLDL